jgi:VCBS repeat-containing protein
MATNSTSFSNTPQASDDDYSFIEDDAALYGYNTTFDYFTWDVMADDSGGKAKKLFSLTGDDASTTQELWDALKTKDGTVWEETEFGRIRINSGKIDYQLGETVNGTFVARDVESLGGNEVINDSFTYAIQLGNGTLSYATVTVNITGANDAASINASANEDTNVVEAGGVANADSGDPSASGTLIVSDVDSGEAAFQAPASASLQGTYGTFTFNATTGAWSYALDQAKADSIPAGLNKVETLTVTSLDGTANYDIVVNIAGTNDAPTITAEVGVPTLADTAAADAFANITGSLDGNDVDTGAALSYNLAAGEDGVGSYGTLTINADGTYTFVVDAIAINALQSGTATDVFNVTVDDGLGGIATTTLTINVSGANDTPTITAEVGVPTLADTEVADTFTDITGTLDGNDVDTGAALSYSLAAGEDGVGTYGSLTVNPDGTYSFVANAAAINALQNGTVSDVFNVTVDDGLGGSATTTLTINVSGANDTPTDVALSGSSVDENTASAVIGTLSASDIDSGDTHSYTVSDSRFEVVGDQLKLKDGASLDFEAESSVNVIVTAEDAGGLTYSETFTLSINDVNEAPTAVVLTNTLASTPENGGAIKVADIAVTDDALGTNTLSLSGADASAFYISGNALYFAGGADFETKSAYNVTVNVNDGSVGGTPDASTNFSLSITDVVENVAPSAQNDKWFISDNTVASLSAVTALLGNDSDANGDAFSITALSNDGISWVTDSSDGVLDNVINLDTSKGALAINTVTGAISYSTDTQTSDTTDSFYYRITDSNASPMADEAQVTISVEDIGTGSTADTVNLSAQTYQVSYISSGNGGDNLSGGSGLDTFLGGAANDILVGGSGNDTIDGGSGDDQITGNAGNDSIDVSAGNDIALYTSILDGNDVLIGFDSNASGGQDVINLDGLFDSYGTMSGTRADHVSIVQSGSDTLVRVDTNNTAGTYEMTITMTSVTASTVTTGSDVLLGS